MGRIALVFGASGISGWAIVREALSYPTEDSFEQVIGLTNRPLDRKTALLPESSRLDLVSGLDLTAGVEKVQKYLEGIRGIKDVTNVYYTAYVAHDESYPELVRANGEILKTALQAVDKACPNVQFWTLQTGGKGYGVEFPDKLELKAPFFETMPRIPEPYASNIFYYVQQDILKDFAASKSWDWCEIRPDAIIGFVPNNNFMNLAQALGLFLSLWRFINGQGKAVPFPGTEKSYRALHTDTSQDILARAHLYTSLHPERTAGRAFNVADGSQAVSWEKVWPGLCQYFGLKGSGPASDDASTGQAWVDSVKGQWSSYEQHYKLRPGFVERTSFDFMTGLTKGADFDRQYDLTAIKSTGFQEHTNTVDGYYAAFSRMRDANILPSDPKV